MTTKNIKYVFDLDRTLWDTYDVRNNPIWAKQLIPPYTLESANKVVDDVGSYCILQEGVKEYMTSLASEKPQVAFLSVGALHGSLKERQPSLQLLRLFGIDEYFNAERMLVYKTEKKDKFLKHMGECVFFDDSDQHLKDAAALENVTVVDRKKYDSWFELVEGGFENVAE